MFLQPGQKAAYTAPGADTDHATPRHRQGFVQHFLKVMGKQGSEGNRAKQDEVGAGRELSPGRAHSRRGTAPLLGTLRKEPLLVRPHQLPPLRCCRPSKQKLSGKFSWKVPRGPSLINDFRKIIQRWINIPQESYFWS